MCQQLNHTRYFTVGGITIELKSDLPVAPTTFSDQVWQFEVTWSNTPDIIFRHHFSIPEFKLDQARQVYRKLPWAIYHQDGSWFYLGILPEVTDLHMAAVFSAGHTDGEIYHPDPNRFLSGQAHSLTFFPTDQIVLARVLADHQACYLHSSGMVIDGHGLAFVGHSSAGKSTITRMLQPHGQILCDDRNILRRWPGGFQVHGTWSHGEIPVVSPAGAPLRGLFFLEKSNVNRITPISSRGEVARRLPFFIIKPLVTADWWEKTLDLVEKIVQEAPAYRLEFDLSGGIQTVIKDFLAG